MKTLANVLSTLATPAQPFLTYYDSATGERVELSGTTTANWVAKTSNFLVEDLDAEPGTRLRLDVPTHWESVVWILSAWNVGAVLTDHDASIAVVGPMLKADEACRVALSLRPMGMRFDPAPLGFLDYNVEVPGHSDHFESFDPPAADSTAIDLGDDVLTHGAAFDWAPPVAERVLLTAGTLLRDCRAVISACRGSGSLVIAVNSTGEQRDKIAADERANPL